MPDMLTSEVIAAYRTALRTGKRYVSERNSQNESGLLPVLESILDETTSDIPLGTHEIPIERIRGTYTAGRQAAFAGNFMPLLDDNTEFGQKWQLLYQSAIDEGIKEPLKVYEYLGYYYVIEGNKRVSVAKYNGMYSLAANITRLMPPLSDDILEHALYREQLEESQREPVGNIWCSEPGRLREIRELAKKKDSENWKSLINHSFIGFRKAYRKLGYDLKDKGITSGDAFWQYVRIYGFTDDVARLERDVKNLGAQLEHIAAHEPVEDLSAPSELDTKPGIFSIFSRTAKLRVLFCYKGTPKTHYWSAIHDVGRFSLEREFPELDIAVCEGLPSDGSGYNQMLEACKAHKPDIVFAVDPCLGQTALRLSLTLKNAIVLHCGYKHIGLLGTYYANTWEPAYLMGIMAGSLTKTDMVGYLAPSPMLGGRCEDMQAFAQGVCTARSTAKVICAYPEKKSRDENIGLLAGLGRSGADILWLPHLHTSYPCYRKSFPGVYAYLSRLAPSGALTDYYAAAAWHWDEFYVSLISEILEGSHESLNAGKLHFRMGLSSGVIKTHGLFPSLGNWTEKLMGHYERLLELGEAAPMDEKTTVEVLELTDND